MKKVLQYGMTSNYGGVEAFIMNIYRNIDRNSIQFDFIVNTEKKISYEDEINSLGGRIIRQKYFSRKKHPFKHYFELYKYFKENKELVAVHINKANVRDIDLLILAFVFKVPVRIIHSHISKENNMKLLEKLNKNIIKKISTHFFACSDEAGKYMFRNNYTVIKDGINVEKYIFNDESRKKIRSKYNINNNDFVIGSIGRFCAQKNTLFIIDIFTELHKIEPNSKLLLIGDGPLLDEVERKIRNEGIEDSVIMPGEVNDVYHFYSAMDVFVFPSIYEGFGMVLLEAQTSGLKCLASKEGIPHLVNITNKIDFISLENDARFWANKALEYKRHNRYNCIEIIKNAGFDSKDVTKKLKNVYLKGVDYE